MEKLEKQRETTGRLYFKLGAGEGKKKVVHGFERKRYLKRRGGNDPFSTMTKKKVTEKQRKMSETAYCTTAGCSNHPLEEPVGWGT